MTRFWKGISWSEGFRIGWLIFWRAAVMGFFAGGVIGFVGGLLGIPQAIYVLASAVTTPLVIWPIVVSQMLSKQFAGFRIQITREPNQCPWA